MRNQRRTHFDPFAEQLHHSPEGPGPLDPQEDLEFGPGRGRGHGGHGRGSDHRHPGPDDTSDGAGPERRRRGPGHGRGFGPRGPYRAGRGDVRLAILSLLADAPSNGYGLISAIAERTGNAWKPSPGSVYPTLQQLLDEELIATSGEGRGTAYELTRAGHSYIEENKPEITRAWAATPGHNESELALHESVTKLKGVIQQLRLAASDAQRTAATEKLDEARRALYLILAD